MHETPAHPVAPDVSIIIVNWNSGEFLARCLATLFAGAGGLATEVIVIDNASYDGSEEMVRQCFPAVTFIQGRENVGFARANNAAASHASGRNLLFLNPDTEVVGDTVRRMVCFVDSHPEAGAVGCKLLNTDGSLQTSCVQAFPTIANQVLDSEFLRRLFPRSALWRTHALFDRQGVAGEVEALSGACILLRHELFLAVGQFSEDYFMYGEDIDLCFKLKTAGLRNQYLGDVCIVHHGGQSSSANSQSQFGNVLMRESIARFLRRHRGPRYAQAYRVALGLAAVVRLGAFGMARALGLGLFRPRVVEQGLRKWTSVLRWTVGAETWACKFGSGSS
jgi:GT2 family glycosyltransferase